MIAWREQWSGCGIYTPTTTLFSEELVFNGVILTDQVKNLDWRALRIDVVGRAPDEVVNECLDKIRTFL